MIWVYAILALLAVIGTMGVGAYVAFDAVRRRALPAPQDHPTAPVRARRIAPAPPESARWREGLDLIAYPERLADLEVRLLESHRAAQQQLQHLGVKHAEIAAKPGRDDLAARYADDLKVLEQRAAATRRVMATVWKTRAILLLRVHLAIAARQRPALGHLPKPLDVDRSRLEAAARSYAHACRDVRAFVADLDARRASLVEVPPKPNLSAEVSPADTQAVEAERAEVDATFQRLRERMDALADTLDYLSERFRTQQVVEGAGLELEVGPEAGRLLDELGVALAELDQLSAVGDKGLADAAVDGLSRDIGKLEAAGREADAEAEASLEVARLLEQFSRA